MTRIVAQALGLARRFPAAASDALSTHLIGRQHVRQLVQKHNAQELLTQLGKLRAEGSPSALEREAADLIQAMRMERESELLAALEHKLALLTSRSSHSVSSVSRSSTAGQEQSAALG